ncbi:mitochondrial fission ELM1 family protein [Pelagibacteraceae bacterium]|nr:mitochondrial fission ELM1 family protein [Candidatus Pelagibacter sp.]MDC1485470.1 mitochondrial fission ELM1 family protein [Pelagibacteraceae bacterium]
MTKLKGLLLTEGMHGMISQVEGLAKALDLDFIHEKIELNRFWKLFPPKITPVQDFVFKNKINSQFDIVISCGRKSVIPSIYLKKKFKNKIVNIHIQEPKVSLDNFDFVVVPEHDGLSGKNVIRSKGAIHYITQKEINESKKYLIDKFQLGNYFNKDRLVIIILGGPNKYYSFSDLALKQVFDKIKINFISKGFRLIVIPSIRTPKRIIKIAQEYFDKKELVITNVDKQAYMAALAMAKYIVVTCDSTSMISEAAITGKPIYVAQMPTIRNNERFKSFFNLFESLNIIKSLNNSVEDWTYTKLNETNRIADQLKNEIKKHDFS